MPPKLQGSADTIGIVIALGFAAVAELNIGLVLEAVELEHTIEIITARIIQPSGVSAGIVTVDCTTGAMTQIQVGFAVTAQQAHQPLAVTDRQGCIGTERQALL